MSRFEMPLGDGALAITYYKVENGRVVLLHTEVPQEPSGLGYGSRLARVCGWVAPHDLWFGNDSVLMHAK